MHKPNHKPTKFGEDSAIIYVHRICFRFQISCYILKRGRLIGVVSEIESKCRIFVSLKIREGTGEMFEWKKVLFGLLPTPRYTFDRQLPRGH